MQVEVVLDYPRTLYTVPGPKSGSGFLPGYTYDELLVETEDEAKEAMKLGFFLTPKEAVTAFEKVHAAPAKAKAV